MKLVSLHIDKWELTLYMYKTICICLRAKFSINVCCVANLDTRIITVRRKLISAITVLTTRGIEDVRLIEGSVDSDLFVHFIEHTLLNISHNLLMEAMQDPLL